MGSKQEETINKIEESLRNWIDDHIEEYRNTPASYVATSTQGEKVAKANPAAQEIRAAFKDYCYIVKTQKEINNTNIPDDVDSVEDIRKRFRIAK